MASLTKAVRSAASKAAQKAKKSPERKESEDAREGALQAVILADSFEIRFHPFTLETPRCLLPLGNTALIDHTLEFLAMSSVSDIYIYSGTHTDNVEKHLQASKWLPSISASSPFNSFEVLRTTAQSVGDAMRDLDARDIITGDFLLVHGDLVSNLSIGTALLRHRQRRAVDKNAIMTMILRSGGLQRHRTKAQGVTPVFVIDPRKDRCLHYDEMHALQANRYINIDPELIKQHEDMVVRTDLMDCGIDICTPDVLALWAESFDYEIARRHFLYGVLKDYELNGKTIHTDILEEGYAARVDTLQAYESVSKDMMGRWTYPLVPDSNLVPGQSYKLSRRGLCKEDGVILAKNCGVVKKSILGNHTSIGDGSVVTDSIIGRRCHIGRNVTIRNAYIWDDVVIGNGSTVDRAVIANEAVIATNCKIQPGVLISYGVRIAENKEIPENARITKAVIQTSDKDTSTSPTTKTDVALVGHGGLGFAYVPGDDEDEETALLQSNLIYNLTHLSLSADSISTLSSELSECDDAHPRSRLSSLTSISTNEDTTNPTPSTSTTFHHDAVNGLLDTLSEATAEFSSAKLEFMGLRLSHDATDAQIRRAVAVAFTKRVIALVEGGASAYEAANQTFNINGAETFVREVALGGETEGEGASEFLRWLQRALKSNPRGGEVLAAVCQRLYNGDVVGEEGFLAWWDAAEKEKGLETEEEGMAKVRVKTGVFVEWLRSAEEESSEEESEEND